MEQETIKEKDPVNQLLEVFHNYNQFFKWGHKGYRKSADLLIKKIGLENAVDLATVAISIQGQPFAPVIINPTQLVNKFGELKAFCMKQQAIHEDNNKLISV